MEWRLLAEVPEDDVRRLIAVARRRRFARGEVVFHRDDPGDSLHLIEKGRFAISVMTPLGDTATITVCGPGESFGEMALLAPSTRRSATITALEPAETFAVFRDDFERLRREHESIDGLVIEFLTNEVRVLHERLLEALYLPAKQRLLRRLSELAAVYGQGDDRAVLPLTQEQLADLAGTSRATVNKVLRDEQQRGSLELGRRRTTILHVSELTRRAH
jgi:CRP/FNR family transcriptional regulator, cyclic AMP receptor protein